MPEEVLIVAITGIIAGSIVLITLFRSIFGAVRARREAGVPAGSSLKTSELEHMMRTAVADAVGPLVAKIDALEQRLDVGDERLLEAPRRVELLDEDPTATPEPVSRTPSRHPLR